MLPDIWVGIAIGAACTAPFAFMAGRGLQRLKEDITAIKCAIKRIRCKHRFMKLAVSYDGYELVCTKCGTFHSQRW